MMYYLSANTSLFNLNLSPSLTVSMPPVVLISLFGAGLVLGITFVFKGTGEPLFLMVEGIFIGLLLFGINPSPEAELGVESGTNALLFVTIVYCLARLLNALTLKNYTLSSTPANYSVFGDFVDELRSLFSRHARPAPLTNRVPTQATKNE